MAPLKQRFIDMKSFLPEYVENFICETGLDDTIDFLPVDYIRYKRSGENTLYCHPHILGEILQRLKGFIGVTSFTTYTKQSTKQVVNVHNFISTFLDVCSVKPVAKTIANDVITTDVAYITSGYDLDKIDQVIDKTKNVVIIEDISRLELLHKLEKYKRHEVISYYHALTTTHPVASCAIMYKSFDMFE